MNNTGFYNYYVDQTNILINYHQNVKNFFTEIFKISNYQQTVELEFLKDSIYYKTFVETFYDPKAFYNKYSNYLKTKFPQIYYTIESFLYIYDKNGLTRNTFVPDTNILDYLKNKCFISEYYIPTPIQSIVLKINGELYRVPSHLLYISLKLSPTK